MGLQGALFLHAALDVVIELQCVRFPMDLLVYITGRAIIPRMQCPMLLGDDTDCYLHTVQFNWCSIDLFGTLSWNVAVM